MLTLEVLQGDSPGRVIRLRPPGAAIGRAGTTVRFQDAGVAPRHAAVRFDDGTWLVEDLGSEVGSYHNNVRLEQPTPLSVGDRLRLGPVRLVVREVSAEAPAVDDGNLVCGADEGDLLVRHFELVFPHVQGAAWRTGRPGPTPEGPREKTRAAEPAPARQRKRGMMILLRTWLG